jgi:hypothetical protein
MGWYIFQYEGKKRSLGQFRRNNSQVQTGTHPRFRDTGSTKSRTGSRNTALTCTPGYQQHWTRASSVYCWGDGTPETILGSKRLRHSTKQPDCLHGRSGDADRQGTGARWGITIVELVAEMWQFHFGRRGLSNIGKPKGEPTRTFKNKSKKKSNRVWRDSN